MSPKQVSFIVKSNSQPLIDCKTYKHTKELRDLHNYLTESYKLHQQGDLTLDRVDVIHNCQLVLDQPFPLRTHEDLKIMITQHTNIVCLFLSLSAVQDLATDHRRSTEFIFKLLIANSLIVVEQCENGITPDQLKLFNKNISNIHSHLARIVQLEASLQPFSKLITKVVRGTTNQIQTID